MSGHKALDLPSREEVLDITRQVERRARPLDDEATLETVIRYFAQTLDVNEEEDEEEWLDIRDHVSSIIETASREDEAKYGGARSYLNRFLAANPRRKYEEAILNLPSNSIPNLNLPLRSDVRFQRLADALIKQDRLTADRVASIILEHKLTEVAEVLLQVRPGLDRTKAAIRLALILDDVRNALMDRMDQIGRDTLPTFDGFVFRRDAWNIILTKVWDSLVLPEILANVLRILGPPPPPPPPALSPKRRRKARRGGASAVMITGTPEDSYRRLRDGNVDFATHPERCVNQLHERRANVAHKHKPWAVIVGCSDSRVPPELVFGGRGLGELFVVRTAGHVVLHSAALGSIEYATAVLGAPLVVVLGHERCGAVEAACQTKVQGVTFPGHIQPLVEAIVPSVSAALQTQPANQNVAMCTRAAIPEHARRIALYLASPAVSPTLAGLVAQGKLWILSAVYSLDTGRVSWLQRIKSL